MWRPSQGTFDSGRLPSFENSTGICRDNEFFCLHLVLSKNVFTSDAGITDNCAFHLKTRCSLAGQPMARKLAGRKAGDHIDV